MVTRRQPGLSAAGSLVGCLILLGCGDPPKTPAAPPPARASALAASAPPPAPSSTAPPRAPSSLPKALPGVDSTQLEVLGSICALASWKSDSGVQIGCRSTPPFDDINEQPDGTIREETSFSDVCFLETFLRGSFSAPGKDEALLGLAPCGNDRANDITPGNIVLAEHDAAGWRVVAVEKNENLRGCVPAKGYNPTLLVCDDNVGAYSEGSIWWRFTLDFSQPPGKHVNVFSRLYKTPGTTCLMGADFFVEREVTLWTAGKDTLADADGDGLDDLTFTIDRSYTPGSPALGRRFDAQCKKKAPGGDQTLDLAQLAGKSRRFKLDFKGSGSRTLVPTDATAKLLDGWGLKAPELWWKMPR
jgi:hypothetical protein